LLEALVACAGVTLKAVATALDVPVKSATVSAEGDLDFRRTLCLAKDAPVGFAQIRLPFDVDTDAPQAHLDHLLELNQPYCVRAPATASVWTSCGIGLHPTRIPPVAPAQEGPIIPVPSHIQWLWVPARAGTTWRHCPHVSRRSILAFPRRQNARHRRLRRAGD